MVVLLSMVQLLLAGLDRVLGPVTMFGVWWASAFLVGVLTFQLEKLFARRRRWPP